MNIAIGFSKVYCENWEQKEKLTNFQNLLFGQKSTYKTGAKEGLIIEEIIVTKEMLSILKRLKERWLKGISEICRSWGHAAQTGRPKKLFHSAQPSRHSEATKVMVSGR